VVVEVPVQILIRIAPGGFALDQTKPFFAVFDGA
jgi:hypothetical protein